MLQQAVQKQNILGIDRLLVLFMLQMGSCPGVPLGIKNNCQPTTNFRGYGQETIEALRKNSKDMWYVRNLCIRGDTSKERPEVRERMTCYMGTNDTHAFLPREVDLQLWVT